MIQASIDNTCCFSGYRPEKMPFSAENGFQLDMLRTKITAALLDAYQEGYYHFVTGMSTGFDLWAAQSVLKLRETKDMHLICAIPFEEQARYFSREWKQTYKDVLLRADQVFILSKGYHNGCYAERNQYMVSRSSHLICFHDGKRGGTAQTVRMAEQAGLTVQNLASQQLELF